MTVGLVNPHGGRFADDLAGQPTDGVGPNWWRKLGTGDYASHQLPETVAGYIRPMLW